mmetsp:Transcript_46364/g.88511  ORF Transcript_46364/g.88511 Transcript_46364/m.88511 type:complete len:389 (-) Transcript_46364:73-1239(-)
MARVRRLLRPPSRHARRVQVAVDATESRLRGERAAKVPHRHRVLAVHPQQEAALHTSLLCLGDDEVRLAGDELAFVMHLPPWLVLTCLAPIQNVLHVVCGKMVVQHRARAHLFLYPDNIETNRHWSLLVISTFVVVQLLSEDDHGFYTSRYSTVHFLACDGLRPLHRCIFPEFEHNVWLICDAGSPARSSRLRVPLSLDAGRRHDGVVRLDHVQRVKDCYKVGQAHPEGTVHAVQGLFNSHTHAHVVCPQLAGIAPGPVPLELRVGVAQSYQAMLIHLRGLQDGVGLLGVDTLPLLCVPAAQAGAARQKRTSRHVRTHPSPQLGLLRLVPLWVHFLVGPLALRVLLLDWGHLCEPPCELGPHHVRLAPQHVGVPAHQLRVRLLHQAHP